MILSVLWIGVWCEVGVSLTMAALALPPQRLRRPL